MGEFQRINAPSQGYPKFDPIEKQYLQSLQKNWSPARTLTDEEIKNAIEFEKQEKEKNLHKYSGKNLIEDANYPLLVGE